MAALLTYRMVGRGGDSSYAAIHTRSIAPDEEEDEELVIETRLADAELDEMLRPSPRGEEPPMLLNLIADEFASDDEPPVVLDLDAPAAPREEEREMAEYSF